MNVLVVNFAMDEGDPILRWQVRVVEHLAERVSHVAVLTERKGPFDLPGNVVVEQIPKPFGIPRRLGSGFLANSFARRFCERHGVEVCFIHMAHQWAYRLMPTWRSVGLPIVLWYAHGTVSRRLRLSHRLVDRVLTSTPEGFRIPSTKLTVIGQGIDTDLFRRPDGARYGDDLLYVGRLSRRKRVDLLIEVVESLRALSPGTRIRLVVVGPTLTTDDDRYREELKALVASCNLEEWVEFRGPLPQTATPALYREAFLHVSLSATGSMDKTVMEALACGCPVLTTNPAFREVLDPMPGSFVATESPEEIAVRVLEAYRQRASTNPETIRGLVVGHHDVRSYVDKVVGELVDAYREKGVSVP